MTKNILIIEAINHNDIAEKLFAGAKTIIENANVTYEKISVPSCFEIPQTLKMAFEVDCYDAYITLGCIIKDENIDSKYMIAETLRSINSLAVDYSAPVAYGIINAANIAQALEHANEKGSAAASSALKMIEVYEHFLEKYEDFEPGSIEI